MKKSKLNEQIIADLEHMNGVVIEEIEEIIVGKSSYEMSKANYNKIAAINSIMDGKKVSFMDLEGEEYKSLYETLFK